MTLIRIIIIIIIIFVTDADHKNDVHSLERKLDDKLILLVKCKTGDDTHWMMPQGNWQEGESLQEVINQFGLTVLLGSYRIQMTRFVKWFEFPWKL